MKNLLLILIMFSVLFSCKKEFIITKEDTTNTITKEGPTIIKGKVINKWSKLPLDNAVVHFYYEIIKQDSLIGGKEDSVYTNKEGRYEFSVPSSVDSVVVWPTKNWCRIWGADDVKTNIPLFVIYKNVLHEKVLEMEAEAGFFPAFKKTSEPHTGEDSLIVSALSYENIQENMDIIYESFLGKKDWKFFNGDGFFAVTGDRYLRYKLHYKIADIWYAKIDSVFIPAFTVYTDTIYY